MKIAIFTDTYIPQINGVVSVIQNELDFLIGNGSEVVVFAPGKKTHMEMYKGAKIYYFSARDIKFYPDYLLVKTDNIIKINAIVEMENPDIYHMHTPALMGIFGLYLSKKYKKPSVGTFHTLLNEYLGHLTKGKHEGVVKVLLDKPIWEHINQFYNHCTQVVSLGRQVANLLKEHGVKRIKIIPNGIDISSLKHEKIHEIRSRYNIPKTAVLFFFLGRISMEKKIGVLIDAFGNANADKKLYLIIGGKGPQLDEYKQYVLDKNIKNVIFAGFIKDEDLYSYYNDADVFISASDVEVCPITFLEAMVFNCAIVGSNKMGSRDMIKNGFNGYLFKNGDARDMSKKMRRVVENRTVLKEMQKNSYAFVKSFDMDETNGKLMRLFDRLISSGVARGDKESKIGKLWSDVRSFIDSMLTQ